MSVHYVSQLLFAINYISLRYAEVDFIMVDLKVFPEKLVCYNYGLCKLNMSRFQSAGMTQGDFPANLHSLFSRPSSKPQNITVII